MSQQLTPTNGGADLEVQTSVQTSRLKVLTPQYIELNNLEARPTQWVPDGRPIYRRLPAVSETYQIDFFNVVTESNITGNTFVGENIEEIGYVFTEYGASIEGGGSLEVSSEDNGTTMVVYDGVIVWKYGRDEVDGKRVDLQVLDVLPGNYEVSYQLVYDDSPLPFQYEATDYSLEGMPLNITASTDSFPGWRYAPQNAFLSSNDLYWSNEDTFFPVSSPATAYLQWESELAQSYSKVLLRCPPSTAYTGTATLSYVVDGSLVEVASTSVARDNTSQYFEFSIVAPYPATGWNVTFSSTTVSVESILVSGELTLLASQAEKSPRANLVMFPTGTSPQTVEVDGKELPAAYCTLAYVDISSGYKITRIDDARSIIHRDYTPIANWLTTPFDSDLIDLYEQVSGYSVLWMAPPRALKQEYEDLSTVQIEVEA